MLILSDINIVNTEMNQVMSVGHEKKNRFLVVCDRLNEDSTRYSFDVVHGE